MGEFAYFRALKKGLTGFLLLLGLRKTILA